MKKIVAVLLVVICYCNTMAGSFTDPRDGNAYRTVKIGDRIWMAENLNYKTRNSKCYDNDISNCQTYGRLYTSEDVVDACPAGWRLPATQDFFDLARAIDPELMLLKSIAALTRNPAALQIEVGNKLKSKDLWKPDDDEVCVKYGCNYNRGAQMRECRGEEQCGCGYGESVCIETGIRKVLSPGEDAYGFSARPAGLFSSDGSFTGLGVGTAFWTKTKEGAPAFFLLQSPNDLLLFGVPDLGVKFSVRCVMNSEELERALKRAEAERKRVEEERRRAEKEKRAREEKIKERQRVAKASIGFFEDKRDGHIYQTVTLANQVWMTQELVYLDEKSNKEYPDLKNNIEQGYIDRLLYAYEDLKNACPEGWRLPSDEDFNSLFNYVNFRYNSQNEAWKADEGLNTEFKDYGFYISRVDPNPENVFGARFDQVNLWTSSGNFFEFSEGRAQKSVRRKNNSYAIRCLRKAPPTSFSTQRGSGQFTDSRDGQTYKTFRIGAQTWFAQNLDYQTENSWCNEHRASNCEKNGRVYDWNTAKDVCPAGWHLPSKQEFIAAMVMLNQPYRFDANYAAFSGEEGWDNTYWYDIDKDEFYNGDNVSIWFNTRDDGDTLLAKPVRCLLVDSSTTSSRKVSLDVGEKKNYSGSDAIDESEVLDIDEGITPNFKKSTFERVDEDEYSDKRISSNIEESGNNVGDSESRIRWVPIGISSVAIIGGAIIAYVGDSKTKDAYEKYSDRKTSFSKSSDDAHNGQTLRTAGIITTIVGALGLGISIAF